MISRRLLLAFLLTTGCGADPSDATRGEAAIRQLLLQQADAWNRHDAKAWVSGFVPDAEFVNIVGMQLVGREQIERRHAELFQGIFSRSRTVVTVRRVRSLGATSALAETEHVLRDYARLPPGIRATDPDGALRTRLKYVMMLRPEGWRIVSAQNTAIAPLPPR